MEAFREARAWPHLTYELGFWRLLVTLLWSLGLWGPFGGL